uniref:NB-ARC domain-containing protein n=1 Tax=Lactuca sativa TaxID=4236 RepID=A0A9R1ULK7_LACSA|nr:hypothetical protein LSAT_V11C800436010 [Lactuca sativa]
MKRELDRTNLEFKMYIEEIQGAEKLVAECSKVKRNIIKMFTYSLKLKVLNKQRDTTHRTGLVGNYRRSESTERDKYGWRVPILPSWIVAFGEPLEKLKVAISNDHPVLVVAALGGCGKTTLAKMLCHDAEIRDAKSLFHSSTFTESESRPSQTINDDLVNQPIFSIAGEALGARSLKKAVVSSRPIEYPSPANLQSNCLSLHVSLADSLVDKGKDSLLIPEQTQVVDSAIVNHCPHKSEIQMIVLNETKSSDFLILGSVDSYGHLIVSRLGIDVRVSINYWSFQINNLMYNQLITFLTFKSINLSNFSYTFLDVERLTFSVSPHDFGVGEGGWAGLCFSLSQSSTVHV